MGFSFCECYEDGSSLSTKIMHHVFRLGNRVVDNGKSQVNCVRLCTVWYHVVHQCTPQVLTFVMSVNLTNDNLLSRNMTICIVLSTLACHKA
jgi:hypothetical protein